MKVNTVFLINQNFNLSFRVISEFLINQTSPFVEVLRVRALEPFGVILQKMLEFGNRTINVKSKSLIRYG